MNKNTKVLAVAINKERNMLAIILFAFLLFLFAMQESAKANDNDNIIIVDEEQKIEPEFESALSNFKKMVGLEELPNDTLAIIDDEIITLRDVEELANLNYIARNDEATLTLDYVLEEYSLFLFDLIEQKIIYKEIEEKGIEVPYSDVEQIESIIRESYQGTFDDELAAEGIDIELWREQLRKRLEKETLQLAIISQIRISPQEIIDYQEEHPSLLENPEKYRVLMLSSSSQPNLQKAYNQKIKTIEDVEKFNNVFVQEGLLAVSSLPEEWEEDIPYMEKNGKTKINHSGNSYKYLVLLEKIPAMKKNEAEIFNQVEQQLREEKADRAYNQWLSKALSETEIKIIPEFATILRADTENSASGLVTPENN